MTFLAIFGDLSRELFCGRTARGRLLVMTIGELHALRADVLLSCCSCVPGFVLLLVFDIVRFRPYNLLNNLPKFTVGPARRSGTTDGHFVYLRRLRFVAPSHCVQWNGSESERK